MPRRTAAIIAVVFVAVGLWLSFRNLTPSGPPPDPLALELRRFRSLTDDQERMEAIPRFGQVQDPRVTVVLMEVVQEEGAKKRYGGLMMLAAGTLVEYHMPKEERMPVKYWTCANMWWE